MIELFCAAKLSNKPTQNAYKLQTLQFNTTFSRTNLTLRRKDRKENFYFYGGTRVAAHNKLTQIRQDRKREIYLVRSPQWRQKRSGMRNLENWVKYMVKSLADSEKMRNFAVAF